MDDKQTASKETEYDKTTVPGDFEQFLIVTRYETLKYLRSKRLLAILIILALVIGLILIVPPALGQDYPQEALNFSSRFVGFSSLLVILCVTLFGTDAIVSEFQHKTGYVIFPNPLKKFVILIGKFTASFLSSILVISLFYGVTMLSTAAVTQSLPWELVLSFLFSVMFLLSALAVAYFLSSVMKGTTGATVLTFFLFFLILPIIETMFTFAGVKPWPSITFSAGIISYILTVPYPTDSIQEINMGDGQTMDFNIFYPEIALSILVMLFYLFIAFLLAYYMFSRKEMK